MCGDSYPSTSASESQCTTACTGDAWHKCGSGSRNSVYRIVDAHERTYAPFPYAFKFVEDMDEEQDWNCIPAAHTSIADVAKAIKAIKWGRQRHRRGSPKRRLQGGSRGRRVRGEASRQRRTTWGDAGLCVDPRFKRITDWEIITDADDAASFDGGCVTLGSETDAFAYLCMPEEAYNVYTFAVYSNDERPDDLSDCIASPQEDVTDYGGAEYYLCGSRSGTCSGRPPAINDAWVSCTPTEMGMRRCK